MKHSWLYWRDHDVDVEQQQAIDEGRDLSSLQSEWEVIRTLDWQTETFQERFNTLLDEIQKQPYLPNYPYYEPVEWEEIVRSLPSPPPSLPLNTISSEILQEKVHGAWLGRCAGCLLGKPVEGWRYPRLSELWKVANVEIPCDYLWNLNLSERDHQELDTLWIRKIKENLPGMPEDDDTNYTVTGLAVIKQHGYQFSSEQVADFWLTNIPILHTCTAERVAYRNFVNNIYPPQSGVVRNPYREWIGAQIRADFFGYAAAGNPLLGAELAWRDGRISHTRNGIYGEMWVAAMLAYAATALHPSPLEVIKAGLACIPPQSRFSHGIRQIIQWYEDRKSYSETIRLIHQNWNENFGHHWCHTISNAQIVAFALLWGDGQADRTLGLSIMPGFDTDCNGATAGSVLGMMYGSKIFDSHWTQPLEDTLYTGIAGYHRVSIRQLAQETLKIIHHRPINHS